MYLISDLSFYTKCQQFGALMFSLLLAYALCWCNVEGAVNLNVILYHGIVLSWAFNLKLGLLKYLHSIDFYAM